MNPVAIHLDNLFKAVSFSDTKPFACCSDPHRAPLCRTQNISCRRSINTSSPVTSRILTNYCSSERKNLKKEERLLLWSHRHGYGSPPLLQSAQSIRRLSRRPAPGCFNGNQTSPSHKHRETPLQTRTPSLLHLHHSVTVVSADADIVPALVLVLNLL